MALSRPRWSPARAAGSGRVKVQRNDTPVVHDRDAGTQALGFLHIVRSQDECTTFMPDPLDDSPQVAPSLGSNPVVGSSRISSPLSRFVDRALTCVAWSGELQPDRARAENPSPVCSSRRRAADSQPPIWLRAFADGDFQFLKLPAADDAHGEGHADALTT